MYHPIAVETYGGCGMEAVDAIKGVSRALARNQTRSGSEVIVHAFQKLSVVLMRGNASILATWLTVASGFFSTIRKLQWRLFGIVIILFKKMNSNFQMKIDDVEYSDMADG